MWMMLQHHEPQDYVVATGQAYSVKEFADKVFEQLNLDPRDFIVVDPRYFRPAEVDFLQGDPGKIETTLGWKPEISFDQMIARMVKHDLQLAEQEKLLKKAGHTVYAGSDQ
jgi:GDPmannose 4,6-dehydratase